MSRNGGRDMGDCTPPRSPLLSKAENAITGLQEQLAQVKRDNERLRQSGQAKAHYLQELQEQLEVQEKRLKALDGKFASGETAIVAACAATRAKDAEISRLRMQIETENHADQQRHDVVPHMAQPSQHVPVSNEVDAAQPSHPAPISNNITKTNNTSNLTGCGCQAAVEVLQTQLKAASSALEEAERRHASSMIEWQNKLTRVDADWAKKLEACQQQQNKVAIVDHDGHAHVCEQLSKDRQRWEDMRRNLLSECQARLDEAEHWMQHAAQETEVRLKTVAADSAQQLDHMESVWAQKLEEAVAAARAEERQKAAQDREVLAEFEKHLDHMVHKRIECVWDEVMTENSNLRDQVERCMEALSQKLLLHCKKNQRRQEHILQHIEALTACSGALDHRHRQKHPHNHQRGDTDAIEDFFS